MSLHGFLSNHPCGVVWWALDLGCLHWGFRPVLPSAAGCPSLVPRPGGRLGPPLTKGPPDRHANRRGGEELLLVDAGCHRMAPVATRVLGIATALGDAGADDLERGSLLCELQEPQIELYTSPHTSMATLEAELRRLRYTAACAAREAGARVVAGATSPVAVEPLRVRTPLYDMMAEASVAARVECQLAILAGPGHRLRELSLAGAWPLARLGADPDLRRRRGVRRSRRRHGRLGRHPRRGHGLLRRSLLASLPDGRDQGG